jgi:hypothetical protein
MGAGKVFEGLLQLYFVVEVVVVVVVVVKMTIMRAAITVTLIVAQRG